MHRCQMIVPESTVKDIPLPVSVTQSEEGVRKTLTYCHKKVRVCMWEG